jgi:hypothetical protein
MSRGEITICTISELHLSLPPDAGFPPRQLTAADPAEQIRQTSMFDANDDAEGGQWTDSHVSDDGAPLTGPHESSTETRGETTRAIRANISTGTPRPPQCGRRRIGDEHIRPATRGADGGADVGRDRPLWE